MGFTLFPESVVQSVRSELRDCLANEIVRPNLEFTSKGFNEFASLFLSIIVMYMSSVIILMVEVGVKKVRNVYQMGCRFLVVFGPFFSVIKLK